MYAGLTGAEVWVACAGTTTVNRDLTVEKLEGMLVADWLLSLQRCCIKQHFILSPETEKMNLRMAVQSLCEQEN